MSDASDIDERQRDGRASNPHEEHEETVDFSTHEGDNEISGTDSAMPFNSKKRKKVSGSQKAGAKRLKGLYRDEYRQLYNSTVSETTSFMADNNPGHLEHSQIGVSQWTVSEKQRFFSALGKYGKDDLPKIAAVVGTKSKPEIRELLLLLQQSVTELHINSEDISKMTAFHEIPAAFEISEDCCRGLEAAADALASYQDSWDAKQEEKKYGDYWLLTPDLADLLDKAAEEGYATDRSVDEDQYYSTSELAEDDGIDEDEEEKEEQIEHAQEALEAVPAAHLLRLSSWLELSARVFANAGGPRGAENWRSIAEDGEQPSIFHTAFTDFHRLAVSVTQRLVAASLSQAVSRLCTLDEGDEKHSRRQIIRREDVFTALQMLNMPRSARSFWVRVPRRCGVMVQLDQNTLSYDEVERILSERPTLSNIVVPTQDIGADDGFTTDAHVSEPSGSDDEAEEHSESFDSKQESYAALFDTQQNQQEEEKLWQILGRNIPPTVKSELPKPPHLDRRMDDELIEWRDVIDFKAEWERYGRPIDPATPENVPVSTSAPTDDVFGAAHSPSAPKRAPVDGRTSGRTSSALGSGDEEDLSEANISSTKIEVDEEASTALENREHEGGVHPTSLPIRRVLAPRRARDAATSSMGELPPYPEDDISSEDDYEDG